MLAAFNLGEFRDHRPAAAVEIVQDGFALGVEPKARLALPIRRYPEIGDEFAPMHRHFRSLMPAHYGKFVAYFRVSTDRQGKSGLGLDAQRDTVLSYMNGGRWSLVAEFTEIESGKRNDRPELEKALAACKKQKAKLVIAKLDRLSRNLAFIATLMDSGVEFIAVDNPHANKLTVHILAAVAQHEREIISARTSAALKAAKARGRRLGNPRLSEARQHAAVAKKESGPLRRERVAGDP